MILLFIGPKGSGKDTQAQLLEKEGFVNISTGALFREEMAKGTELGKKSKSYYDAGKLIPDELVLEILKNHIQDLNAENIILNGVIRTVNQIQATEDMLASLNEKIDLVLYFNFSDEEAIERLANRWTCPKDNRVYHTIYDAPKVAGICDNDGEKLVQRADDKPEAVKMRLQEDRQKTGPVAEAYKERGMLVEIDASKSIEEVSGEIETILTNHASGKAEA